MKIDILDEAGKDLVEGFEFYERQSKVLGRYFLDCIFSDIESLETYAGIHSVHFGYHRLLAKHFPFAVYYRVRASVVEIYAVLDCRRNPAWIRNRLA